MKTMTLTGHAAIDHAEVLDLRLSKHADPVEGERHDLSVDDAREIAKADPSLIYIQIDTTKAVS